MSRSPVAPRLFATLVLVAGGVASVATSQPNPPLGGILETSANGPAIVLDSANRSASVTVTIALNEPASPPDEYLFGGLVLDATACVPAEDLSGRLRVSLVPELPIEGSVIELDVPACPTVASFHLDLYTWNSCVQGEACAERYDVHFERLDPALSASGMGVTFSARANSSGYDDELPPEGAELTVIIE